MPVCNHGISTTIAVILNAGKCPHEDEAMDCFVLCEGQIRNFQEEHRENIRILDLRISCEISILKQISSSISFLMIDF